ncbi:MAG: hypothetical protein K6T83_10220, partial [Alicyclobacillus sp.]|nr:hypothetical protein [Alicyclobacillus sp.]
GDMKIAHLFKAPHMGWSGRTGIFRVVRTVGQRAAVRGLRMNYPDAFLCPEKWHSTCTNAFFPG